ncbi:MAG: hypothetical protein LBF84_03160 [Holosporales bacterium]|jgi:hypothetical protein|nr:hypothetical protein [Holosporales bacterium]
MIIFKKCISIVCCGIAFSMFAGSNEAITPENPIDEWMRRMEGNAPKNLPAEQARKEKMRAEEEQAIADHTYSSASDQVERVATDGASKSERAVLDYNETDRHHHRHHRRHHHRHRPTEGEAANQPVVPATDVSAAAPVLPPPPPPPPPAPRTSIGSQGSASQAKKVAPATVAPVSTRGISAEDLLNTRGKLKKVPPAASTAPAASTVDELKAKQNDALTYQALMANLAQIRQATSSDDDDDNNKKEEEEEEEW